MAERPSLPDGPNPRAQALRDGKPVPPPREALAPEIALEGPYRDDAEYLEHQLRRIRVRLEAALASATGDAASREHHDGRERQLSDIIAARVAATRAAGRTPGLEGLRERFGLDAFETDAILHALAPTLDATCAKLYAKLAGAAWRNAVDVNLVIQIHFDGVAARLRARSYFLVGAKLLANRLLNLDRTRPDARESLLACELKLPTRVARLVLGQDLAAGVTPYSNLIESDVSLDDVVLSDGVRADLEQLLAAHPHLAGRLSAWHLDRVTGRGVVVLLAGPPGTGKSTLARAVAHRLGKRLLVVDANKLLEATGTRGLEEQVDDLFQEARLQDAVVLFDECEFLFGNRSSGNRQLGTMLRALDRFEGMAVLATNLPERLDAALDRRVLLRIALEVPPPPLREKIWRLHLPPEVPLAPDVELAHLAKRYDFSGGYIKNAVLLAANRALARGGAELVLTKNDLEVAAQQQLRGDITSYAERTTAPDLTLDRLILKSDVKSQIEEVIQAGKNRGLVLYGWGFNEKLPTGKGMVVLLSGDPGTGKTLSAEIIAAELGMSLYRVNPAKVVSKYVGETEKNLNEILGQAKSMHAVLFFDEADALFASRVEKVESANDRFVNMETNFLLQQLERYEGIVILATNLDTMIDQAFRRRIHYHIEIPFPEAEDRERIWRGLVTARAPFSKTIDWKRLAKTFELSGGHIKNAVLRGAYLAAQKGGEITMELLAEAAERECGAAGKLFQNTILPTAPAATQKTAS